MRHVLKVAGIVALVAVLAFGTVALAGKARKGKRQGGGTRDRIRDCAQVCLRLQADPCATRDQSRDQDRDGIRDQDRDRDRLCDCGQYIDADGDGYCDNCDCPGQPQDGTGKQQRKRG